MMANETDLVVAPIGFTFLIVKFTANYNSIKCYKEECTGFSGNKQSNWGIRLRKVFLQSIQNQKETKKIMNLFGQYDHLFQGT